MKKVKLNPTDLFKAVGVENEEEALKVFEATLSFLLYIEVGDEIKLPSVTIKKLSNDILAIDQKVTDRETMLRLFGKRVIEVDI